LVLVPDRARGGDGGLNERMGPRRESRGPVTHAPDVQRQRSGTGEPVAILLVQRLAHDGLDRSVELLERAGILAAEVEIKPSLLRNRIETCASTKPHHGVRGAWCVL